MFVKGCEAMDYGWLSRERSLRFELQGLSRGGIASNGRGSIVCHFLTYWMVAEALGGEEV